MVWGGGHQGSDGSLKEVDAPLPFSHQSLRGTDPNIAEAQVSPHRLYSLSITTSYLDFIDLTPGV